MLRARIDDLVVLGVDEENIKRLKEGKPIFIDLTSLGMTGKVCIMYGETLKKVKEDLENATGIPIPDVIFDQEQNNG